jgi:hypothetical protein
MGIRDWDIVTSYVDSVTTTLKTVTFPKVQEQVKVKNQGNANLTYTIGSQSGTLTPGQSVTVNESISSFTIQAASGTQAFELRAKEKGTEQTETETDVISGWLQPLSSAQAYTDLIWNAYMSFKGKNARVGILDTQTLLFGRTCQTKANNQLMNDVLHPSTTGTTGGGYQNLGRLIATCIGITKPTRDDLIYSAIVQNSAKPYLVYPRYLESKPDQYELIAQGYFVGIGSNYLDFAFDGTQAYKIQIGDIIKVGDWATFDFLTGTATASGANTRIAGGITFANYASANKGIVKIFRKKGTNKAAKSFFGKSTINGQVLGDFTIPQAMRISTIRCVTTTPIGATIDLKLRKYYQNTVKDIATISFAINNMTAVTITWDATNAPNSYLDTNSDDIYTLECTSTTYTGTVSFNLTLS